MRHVLVVLAILLVLSGLSLAQDAPPVPAPQAPGHTWLSPQGLETILLLLVFVVLPLVAVVSRRLGFTKAADKLEAVTKDAQAMRGALTSLVAGAERFRKLSGPMAAREFAEEVEKKAVQDGTQGVLDAVVQAVTAPTAPPSPAVAAALPLAQDPVILAVRSATGRLENGRVA